MSTPQPRHRLRFGIILHGTTVWISELFSIVFVWGLLAILTALSSAVLWNELRIGRHEKAIVRLRAENSALDHQLQNMREKRRITAALLGFAGQSIDTTTLDRLVELVYTNSRQYGYDPLMVLAVISTESIFNTKARGRYRSGEASGALGLMQLKFETAREIATTLGIPLKTEEDLLEPEVNIVLGIAYLTKVIAQFKSLKLGILAYNQGPGVIRGTLARQEPLSMRYYEKVLRSYYRLKDLADQYRSAQIPPPANG